MYEHVTGSFKIIVHTEKLVIATQYLAIYLK